MMVCPEDSLLPVTVIQIIDDDSYKPVFSSAVQILHQPAPGSEGDGSFNNLISALGLEGTLSKNKYIINQNKYK